MKGFTNIFMLHLYMESEYSDYSHFTDEETEVQRDYMTCFRLYI